VIGSKFLYETEGNPDALPRVAGQPHNLKPRMKPWQPHRKPAMSSKPSRSPEPGARADPAVETPMPIALGRVCARGAHRKIPPRRDHLLSEANGTSLISMEYFAIVFADRLEAPKHSTHRFIVDYRLHVPPPEPFPRQVHRRSKP